MEIAVELTNVEVLTAAICHDAVGLGRYDVLTYVQRDAIGTVKAGACAWDITASEWEAYRVIAPVNSVFAAQIL